jgi:hypothetical protein
LVDCQEAESQKIFGFCFARDQNHARAKVLLPEIMSNVFGNGSWWAITCQDGIKFPTGDKIAGFSLIPRDGCVQASVFENVLQGDEHIPIPVEDEKLERAFGHV